MKKISWMQKLKTKQNRKNKMVMLKISRCLSDKMETLKISSKQIIIKSKTQTLKKILHQLRKVLKIQMEIKTQPKSL